MFSRTPSGIRNIHLFFEGSYLVFVEGQDDVIFWGKFFPEQLNGYKRKLKPLGGKLEVQKYIDELLKHENKFAVAMDSDYRLLLECLYNHPRIVETKFHSIENLMLRPDCITSLIRDLSGELEYESNEVNSWLEQFDSATYSLMVADLLIEKNKIGKACVGDNCSRFLVEEGVPILDIQKINSFIKKLSLPFEEFDDLNQQLKEFKPRYHIRGHFLSSAVLFFIKHEVKRISDKKTTIPKDIFYTLSILSIKPDIPIDLNLQILQKQVLIAAEEVTKLLDEGN